MRGQPRHGVLAQHAFGADAPEAAADFAAAFGAADARVGAVALDAVRRRLAEAHAMEGIGAPRFTYRNRPRQPAGRGDRRVHGGQAALRRWMLSAYAVGSPP